MSNYLIDQMVWSYSRINCYMECPYHFFLKYIYGLEEKPMFFSSYGSFVHEILAQYYSGKISRQGAHLKYVSEFHAKVLGKPPSTAIFSKFYSQGAQCMQSLVELPGNVQLIESQEDFEIGRYRFTGFIDCVYIDKDGSLVVLDHKSHDLKPRSHRAKPTASDRELDEYLKQLYLYSIPVEKTFSKNPDFLEFSCYRTGTKIKEEFHTEKLAETVSWAIDSIHQIEKESEWSPRLDYWRCNHLCGLKHECEYAQMG